MARSCRTVPGFRYWSITHKWTGGEHVEKIDAAAKTKEYTVKGGAMDTNEAIIISAGGK